MISGMPIASGAMHLCTKIYKKGSKKTVREICYSFAEITIWHEGPHFIKFAPDGKRSTYLEKKYIFEKKWHLLNAASYPIFGVMV